MKTLEEKLAELSPEQRARVDEEVVRLREQLAWKANTPAEEGWYWYMEGDDAAEPCVVQVFKRPGHKYLAVAHTITGCGKRDFQAVNRMPGIWAGPILPPVTVLSL